MSFRADPARPAGPAQAARLAQAAGAAERGEAVARLEALAGELAERGWKARLEAPPGRLPSVYAGNPVPGAAVLSERIYAQPRADGTWAYWWPWAQPIATAPADAAAVIVRVLRPAGPP